MKVNHVIVQAREKSNHSSGGFWIVDVIHVRLAVPCNVDDRGGHAVLPKESTDRNQVALDSAMRRRIRT
jgi:hypothetical protein